MVRLKWFAIIASMFGWKFQLQMVRLKSFRLVWICSSTRVSIPNGSIKIKHRPRHFPVRIMFQFQMVRLKYKYGQVRLCQLQFQFQMVRLKCCAPHVSEHLKRVSIPNGSIKILSCRWWSSLAERFQFQMVRLKMEATNGWRTRVVSFNSKWFD